MLHEPHHFTFDPSSHHDRSRPGTHSSFLDHFPKMYSDQPPARATRATPSHVSSPIGTNPPRHIRNFTLVRFLSTDWIAASTLLPTVLSHYLPSRVDFSRLRRSRGPLSKPCRNSPYRRRPARVRQLYPSLDSLAVTYRNPLDPKAAETSRLLWASRSHSQLDAAENVRQSEEDHPRRKRHFVLDTLLRYPPLSSPTTDHFRERRTCSTSFPHRVRVLPNPATYPSQTRPQPPREER